MKKSILILICAFAMTLNVSKANAQTRKSTARPRTNTTAKAGAGKSTAAANKPKAVDMGLSVKWSDMDLGAANKTSTGKLYKGDQDVAATFGAGWRMPTRAEVKELLENTRKELFLTQAGAPSYIKLYSTKNGATINLYFPKDVSGIRANGFSISTPNQGIYSHFLWATDSYCMATAMKIPANITSMLKQMVQRGAVGSLDVKDWPDELAEQLDKAIGGNGFFTVNMSHGGTMLLEPSSDMEQQYLIRPVYSVDDDE